MKYYAVATDTVRSEPFGLVVKNGSGSICYGFHAAGSEWADLYNTGEIKTLEEGLPPDIELGHFGRLHFDVEDMLEKSPETIPTPEMFVLVESEWLPNTSTGLGLTHVPLVGISKKSRQLALDYKAHAFLTDSRHSSALLKARLSGRNLVPDNSSVRRTVRELLQTKALVNTRHLLRQGEMETKGLGRGIGQGARRARRIGRGAGRSAAGFDADARDADLDMLVQEGTIYERPALPGKPNLPGTPSTARRTPADRDRSARRMRQGLGSSRSDAHYQPDDDPEYEKEYERQWDRFRSAMQDWTLDELSDELPQDGWSKLQDFTSTLDEDELDAQFDKPIKDLPEEWQKAIRDLSEAAFNGDPDALMEMDGLRRGPGPPDSYDAARDRQMDDDAGGGLRSFREFDRIARENAPYDSPESRRHSRESKEEWKRIVEFLMHEHQERADLMARLYPDQSPEDHAPSQRVLSREEAIKELQRRAGISRILPGGGGIAELRKRTSEKYLADMDARAEAARVARGGKPIPRQYHVAQLTSDEILALEDVVEGIWERWERASEALIQDARSNPDVLSRPLPSSISLTGKMSRGDERGIIQELENSIYGAHDEIRKPFSKRGLGRTPEEQNNPYYRSGRMQFGNRKRVDDTIDFLQALQASQDEPWDDLSDLIGVHEGVRDGDKGKYESPNLWMDVPPATGSGLSSRRDTSRSRRDYLAGNLSAVDYYEEQSSIASSTGPDYRGDLDEAYEAAFEELAARVRIHPRTAHHDWDALEAEDEELYINIIDDLLDVAPPGFVREFPDGELVDYPQAQELRGGLASQRGNDPWAEGPTPEEERGLDALTKRVGKTPIGKLYDSDEISNRSNGLLDELITENNWDITDDDGADFGKTLDELLPDRGTAGDTRSKFLASVEEDFWDDPSKYMNAGRQPGPDPYDVQQDRRMEGLASQRAQETADIMGQAGQRSEWAAKFDDDIRNPLAPERDPDEWAQIQREVWQDQVNDIMAEQGLSEEDAIEELAANPPQGMRSQRDDPRDPDDWREAEEELRRLRTHPGAPSEENPGGTREYWKQPVTPKRPSRIVPNRDMTLGEESLLKESGFAEQMGLASRREGDFGGVEARGSNDPYDPSNDPPPMVRAMRSDGTTVDQVDPEWLKRHPEGVQGWLDKHDPDDGPESRYAQDPDNWREAQEEIRDMMDQRIEESLNRMTDEMRQEEFTRGNELEEAGRQALDDIEWAREAGFRSFIDRDFDPERDIDPDQHHDDPFVRDQKLNEAIFNDRMTPMAFDAVADKYDMDRVEVRRREMEHMSLLSGQERYEAQPDLNRRIFEDRVGFRMTIEEVAEKYDMDRAEVRMREITHAYGRSGQEKFNTQPNLNRRLAESRMRGMSLDEVADRFNMDPEEVRFREVAYLGTSPEMFQYAEDAARDPGGTGGFRSVRTGETLAERLEGRDLGRTEGGDDATEAPEAPAVDTAKVNSLNRQIDALRDGKIKPLFKRIDEAQGKNDTKAVHSLRKQVRPLQESEAELREQLGEAMGKGRVASGYRSSRTTDDWDADWREAREEAESTIAELSEQIGDERGKKKPNKKKINELAQQQLAAIEKARERGLRSSHDGAPWSDPERSAARRAVSQRFWSQGGEITDAERHSIGSGGLQSQREPSRARMRTATTQRAARPLGLASRRGDDADKTMMTLPTLYREDSPRQPGTDDGAIWDSLTDDAGVMSPAHAKAFEDAADQLEIELMSGRQDISPRANSFDSGLAGGNAGQHQTYESMFGVAVRAEMIRSGHIGKDDPTPPVTEWRLEQIGRGENTGVRTFEQAFQVQLLETTGTVGQRITTKRKLLDSLQVLQQMRRSGNYEALEHLHPEARKRFLDIARSKDQTLPEKIKGVTKTGGKKSTVWGAIAGHDSMDEYKKHVKRRSRKFRQKMPKGEDKGPIRERIGTAILSPGVPAAYVRRQQLAARRRAAQAGGAGTGGPGPTKSVAPWKKKLSPLEQLELKRAKKKAKKLGKLTSDQRLGRINENRTSGVRDVDKPLSGAAATTYFAGTGDDLEQWEKVEGALVVDSTFIDRLARLTRVRRGTATGKDAAKKRQKGKDSPRTRDDIIDASWFHAGHSGLPEMVGPEEIQDVVFEPDPDYPGRFKLREGFKPMSRGLGRDKDGNSREGDVYWEQWTRLVSRFVGGQGGEVHGAGENNAEPPVRVRKADGTLTEPVSKGFMFGGYGSGPLTFITPETRLVGWGKLAEINDEAESIVEVLSGAGLIDTEAPTSIKHDGDNFSAAVRAALNAAEKATGGRLQVKGRADHREPRDPNNPSKILPTGSGFGIGGSTGSTKPMVASWRDTEFGSIVDQVLDLHDSGKLDPAQLEAAWDFLGKLPASVQRSGSREDHFLFDTLPIYGYDAVQRHGGVISLSNRASVMVLDHPVTGDEITKIIEGLAKEGKLDQARLRELIPSYGSFH